MQSIVHFRATVAAVAVAIFALAATAVAAPSTTLIDGVLLSTGGAVAADGVYDITVSIYADKTAKTPIWKEGPIKIGVKSGRFQHVLGVVKTLDPAKIAAANAAHIAIAIGSDPEMPRTPIHSVLFAHAAGRLACSGCVNGAHIAGGSIQPAQVGFAYAGAADGIKGGAAKTAKSLQCSGCVGVKQLKFDGDLNLGSRTLTAAKLTSGGDVVAKGIVAAKQFLGDGSKLSGIKIPSGACKTKGHVVQGINPDGSLKCVKAMDPTALPPDGIDEISNGLLNNQFNDSFAGKANVAITDNSPKAAISELDFPDIGLAQKLDVALTVKNSDITKVTVFLLDPSAPPLPKTVATIVKGFPNTVTLDPKWKHYVLHKGGGKKGATLDTVYPAKTKPVSGDLGAWIGKNPKGKWRLLVVDHAYLDNKIDGAIVKWNISIRTLSNQKIGLDGNLIAKGSVQVGASKIPCNKTTAGTIRWTGTYFEACNGFDYFRIKLFVSNGTKIKPAGKSCRSIKQTAGDAETGMYWVQADSKKAPEQVYCDMDRHGGGWTLAMNLDTNGGGHRHYFDTTWWAGKSTYGNTTNPLTNDYKHPAHYEYPAGEIMIVAHREGSIEGTAQYQFLTSYKGKTLQWMFANLSNKTVTGTRVGGTGSVGNNGHARNAGDAFIDHSHALIFNSRYQPKDATNYTRIGTNYGSTCGTISCNGHNYGGLGGRHARGGWGAYYEAAQLNGYCNTQGVYGSNHSAYAGNNAASGCGYKSRDMDFAIYVR